MARFSFALVFMLVGFALGWILKSQSLDPVAGDSPEYVNEQGAQTPRSVIETLPKMPGNEGVQSPLVQKERSEQQAKSSPGESEGKTHASILEKFKWLLENNRNKEAVFYFQDVERRQPELLPALKRELIATLKQRLQSSQFESFSSLAEYWLNAYYSDIDVLLLLADYNARQNYYGEAISLYQIIYSYTTRDGELAEIDNEFTSFVHARDARLMEQEAWYELQSFYELIEQAGIAKSAHIFRLAEIYLHNGYVDDARYMLNQLASSGRYQSRAEQLLAEIESGDYEGRPVLGLSQQTLPLERMGQHFLATLTLEGNVQLKLLLDTGASVTSVSRSTLVNKMPYVSHSFGTPRLFHTANGVVRGEVLQLPSVYFAGFELKDVEVAVVPIPETGQVDGLLGMNILSQFRFHIDQDTAELVLDRK